MKQLPEEKILLELLEMAKSASQKAKVMSNLATEIDEKLRRNLEKIQVTQFPYNQSKEK